MKNISNEVFIKIESISSKWKYIYSVIHYFTGQIWDIFEHQKIILTTILHNIYYFNSLNPLNDREMIRVN